MADVKTDSAALALDTASFLIADRQIRLAERQMVLGQFATRFKLRERMGKTLRVTRHKRLEVPRKPLTEGVPPDAVALVVENVDVTVEQWGIVALLTDVGLMVPHHSSLEIAVERKSMVMAEMFEREIAEVLLTGSTVHFAGTGNTDRAGLLATDVVDTALILKVSTSLRNKGAAPTESNLYGGVMPPQIEADVISADVTFKDASTFANVRKLEFAEIGVWMSVRWLRGNFLPVFKGVGAAGTQSAEVSGFSESGAGGAFGGADIVIVAKDKQSGYERKISVAKITAAGSDSATITTPTSTAYLYDIYSEGDAGTAFRLVFEDVPANTAKVLDPTSQAAGALKDPPAGPASGVEVFTAFIFGKDAYGRVELNRMSLQSYITPPGASFSNPLAQGRKVGSKVMWKAFLMDNNYLARIEAGSAFGAELPA